jgi:peptide deformylase
MSVKPILLLGNPRLYEVSSPVTPDELPSIQQAVTDLHDTISHFKRAFGYGRAIAAPQIGVMKRLIYMLIDEPEVIINPVLENLSEEMIDLWDDCMSFPDLMVRVRRHKTCTISFRDLEWQEVRWELSDDLSELLQHEYDHLDGILATQRAIDGRGFALRGEVKR